MNHDGSGHEAGSAPPTSLDGPWSAPPPPGAAHPSVPTPRLPEQGPAAPPAWPPQQWPVAPGGYPGGATNPGYPGGPPGYSGTQPGYSGTQPGYAGTVPGPPGYPPPAPPPGGSGGGRAVLIGVLVAIVLLAAGGGVFWFVSTRDGGPVDQAGATEPGGGGAPPAGTGAPSAGGGDGGVSKGDPTMAPRPTATRAPEPPGDPVPTAQPPTAPPPEDGGLTEAAAAARLETQRAVDAARVPLDGRWVAQVASKYVGISDPLQTAANGSHTFYAVDIWLESRDALHTVTDPNRVYLLSGTDFGRSSTGPGGQPFWITVVDGGFGSEAEVDAWCAATYPGLDAEHLENACAGRTLTPPS